MKDFKKGDKVRVVFEQSDAKILRTIGRFSEYIDIGIPDTMYAIVRIGKFASVLVPKQNVARLS